MRISDWSSDVCSSDLVPLSMGMGLYQGDKLGSLGMVAYGRALNTPFLPRLLVRLEDQIRTNIDRPDYIYEALKVYLMLGNQGPMDRSLVTQWPALDWAAAYPGDANLMVRQDLAGQLDALL